MKRLHYYYQLFIHLFQNMGPRYVVFRFWYEMQRRSGLLQLRFRVKSKSRNVVALADWQHLPVKFFFDSQNLTVRRGLLIARFETSGGANQGKSVFIF
jgi:hypothetical protein